MFDGMLDRLSAGTLGEERKRVDAAMVIRDPVPLQDGLRHLLTTMHDIASDQSSLCELDRADGEENPFEEAIAFLSFAKALVPSTLWRPAGVLLLILHRSLRFSAGGPGGCSEEELIARTDETLANFGLEGVSLQDLWARTADYVDQRQKLWTAIVGLLVTVGEQCHLPDSP